MFTDQEKELLNNRLKIWECQAHDRMCLADGLGDYNLFKNALLHWQALSQDLNNKNSHPFLLKRLEEEQSRMGDLTFDLDDILYNSQKDHYEGVMQALEDQRLLISNIMKKLKGD